MKGQDSVTLLEPPVSLGAARVWDAQPWGLGEPLAGAGMVLGWFPTTAPPGPAQLLPSLLLGASGALEEPALPRVPTGQRWLGSGRGILRAPLPAAAKSPEQETWKSCRAGALRAPSQPGASLHPPCHRFPPPRLSPLLLPSAAWLLPGLVGSAAVGLMLMAFVFSRNTRPEVFSLPGKRGDPSAPSPAPPAHARGCCTCDAAGSRLPRGRRQPPTRSGRPGTSFKPDFKVKPGRTCSLPCSPRVPDAARSSPSCCPGQLRGRGCGSRDGLRYGFEEPWEPDSRCWSPRWLRKEEEEEGEMEEKGTIPKVGLEGWGLRGPLHLGGLCQAVPRGPSCAVRGSVCLRQGHDEPARAKGSAEPSLRGAGGPRPGRGWLGGSRALQPCLAWGAAVSPPLQAPGRCPGRSPAGRLWMSWESCWCIWGWSRRL